MNKAWVESKEAEYAAAARAKRAEIIAKINSAEFLTDKDKEALVNIFDKECNNNSRTFELSAILRIWENRNKNADYSLDFLKIKDFVCGLNADEYEDAVYKANSGLRRYLDSEPMEFDGDIIITDPCYIMRAENNWGACDYGRNMEALGIHHYLTRDTIYGDWSCTVYDTDTDEAIGEFCADAGLVSVFLLDEVLKYNPDFDYHKERTWTTALIPDFKGTVQFVVEHEEGVFEEDTRYWRAGEKWEEYRVHVVGHGVNKKTGKPINFRSTQTGL